MAENRKKIAVLSGKGGTGKTLVSVNLAATAGNSTYIDCDVEEPNGHLFFKPEICREYSVTVPIPVVDQESCDGCRICSDFCRFNALAYVKDKLLVFEEVCHSCGGCVLLCPQKALKEKEKPVGTVKEGFSGSVLVRSGILNVGEASGVPVIQRLLELPELEESRDGPIFIDCPPGSACIVMESIKDADFCLLVAEPTMFGVHNLNMVWELVRVFKKPFGVVLNKCMRQEQNPAETFCLEKKIPVLGRIPFDPEWGRLNAEGRIVAREKEECQRLFASLLETLMREGETV